MRKLWTALQIESLIKLYPDCKTATLVPIFGRSASMISSKASSLGVKKSEGFLKSSLSGRISSKNDIGVSTRFKALQPGWNKGMKQSDYMSKEMIEKTSKTRFKKGQDPHNTVPIGYERISRDGYIEVKVRHLKNGDANNKNFIAKHRIIYIENFGEIPGNCNVEFKDGDKFNLDPNNLILRTKKENLINNSLCDKSIVKRFMGVRDPNLIDVIINEMPETIDLKRKNILLNKEINKKNAKKSK